MISTRTVLNKVAVLAVAVSLAATLAPKTTFALVAPDPTLPRALAAAITPTSVSVNQKFTLDGSASFCPKDFTCTYAWSVYGPGFSRLGTPLRQQPGLQSTGAGSFWIGTTASTTKKVPVVQFSLSQKGTYQFSLLVVKNNGQRLAPRNSTFFSIAVK